VMQKIWSDWQKNADPSSDVEVVEGIRQNIEHSGLAEKEKALWLERLEEEVLR
jgi:hypothetical protein